MTRTHTSVAAAALALALLAAATATAQPRTHTGLLAYVAGTALYVSRPDGSAARLVAQIPQGVDHPSWSPDGQQLVFADYVSGYGTASCAGHGLWVVNVDGSNLHRLRTACVRQPAWSPDGAHIAYTTRLKRAGVRDADFALSVMNADGSNAHRLTQITVTAKYLKRSANWVVDATPTWSPDGSVIAYATGHDESDYHLAFITPARAPAGQIPSVPGTFDAFPSFAPDGSELVFARRSDATATNPPQIVVARRDGTGASVIGAGGLVGSPSPSWSPDGSRIAWSTDTGIEIAAPDGSSPTTIPLPNGGEQGFEPVWQPLP